MNKTVIQRCPMFINSLSMYILSLPLVHQGLDWKPEIQG